MLMLIQVIEFIIYLTHLLLLKNQTISIIFTLYLNHLT